MSNSKILILTLFGIFVTQCSLSQHSHRNSKSPGAHARRDFTSPKIRSAKARIICPIFESSKYPYHGLGFKVGDPFSLTYKFYASQKFSLAVDFGKAASGLYN